MEVQWVQDFLLFSEEVGFLDLVEEKLPPEFTLLYEIARVIEDPNHPLANRLAPVLELIPPSQYLPPPKGEKQQIPIIQETLDFEPSRIRYYHEIQYIFPYQFLAPPEVFDRRLAERTLFLPRAAAPKVYGFEKDPNRYAPDYHKQKVYVLLDTSASMYRKYRILLAKAVAILFLRRNMKELGEIYFRTFDKEVSPLFVAKDQRSYRELLARIARIQKLGNGTVLAKALRIACEDLRTNPLFSGAEILVITDGAVHLDIEKIRQWLGNDIVLNTVKIGHAQLELTEQNLRDLAYTDESEDAKTIRKLFDRVREIEVQYQHSSSDQRRRQLQQQLQWARQNLQSQLERMRQKLGPLYGREIEQLSQIYVEVDDLEPEQLFRLTAERLAALRKEVQQLATKIREINDAALLKQFALLYDHLLFLAPFQNGDSEFQSVLQFMDEQLWQFVSPTGEIADQKIAALDLWDRKHLRRLLKPLVRSIRKISPRLWLQLWWEKLKRIMAIVKQRWKHR